LNSKYLVYWAIWFEKIFIKSISTDNQYYDCELLPPEEGLYLVKEFSRLEGINNIFSDLTSNDIVEDQIRLIRLGYKYKNAFDE